MNLKKIVCAVLLLFCGVSAAIADAQHFATDRYGDKYFMIDYGWCDGKTRSCPKGRHLAVVIGQTANEEPAVEAVAYMYHYTPDGKRCNKIWHRFKSPDWMNGGGWHETPQDPKHWENVGTKSIAAKAYSFAAKKMGLRR